IGRASFPTRRSSDLTLENQGGYINYAWLGGDGIVINGVGLATFFETNNWIMYIYITIVLVGGSMLTMWIGERITEYGVSNGISRSEEHKSELQSRLE